MVALTLDFPPQAEAKLEASAQGNSTNRPEPRGHFQRRPSFEMSKSTVKSICSIVGGSQAAGDQEKEA